MLAAFACYGGCFHGGLGRRLEMTDNITTQDKRNEIIADILAMGAKKLNDNYFVIETKLGNFYFNLNAYSLTLSLQSNTDIRDRENIFCQLYFKYIGELKELFLQYANTKILATLSKRFVTPLSCVLE